MNSPQVHQLRVKILYKPRLGLLIADWHSRDNHKENKDAEIPIMDVKVDAIQTITNIPECMSIQQLQQATAKVEHSQ